MATIKLTARAIPELEPGEYWDEVVRGLHLRVSLNGRRTFALRYRVGGEQPRERLGVFHPRYYTLERARADARAILARTAGDPDPGRQRADATLLFEPQARRVLERRHSKGRLREATRRERERILDKIILPRWAHSSVLEITRADVLELRASLSETPAQANRAIRLVSLIFNELLDDELVVANPAHRIKPLEEAERKRRLTPDELGEIWRALGDEGAVIGGALRVTLLTAQQVGAVRRMRWEQIRGTTWRAPPELSRANRELWVPLSQPVFDVLDGLSGLGTEWVFPAQRSDGTKGHLVKTDPVPRRLAKRIGIAPFRVQDFREAFRFWSTTPTDPTGEASAVGCGIDPSVADAVLGRSVGGGPEAGPDGRPRDYLLAEMRDALERWGRFVLQCAG